MLEIIGLQGIPEVGAGDDLPGLIVRALVAGGLSLQAGDILVVTSKIVSKAEGRTVWLRDVAPSPFATAWAAQHNKEPRHVEVVLREARRIVRMDRGLIVAETHHGFICANAGVDHSNSGSTGELLLLPLDPDASARSLRHALCERARLMRDHPAPSGRDDPPQDPLRISIGDPAADLGRTSLEDATADVAVIISDTFGRPWRLGQTNIAIGAAGIKAVRSYVGQQDPLGMTLRATGIAVIDELAAAAELVMGKLDRVPVALIRGYAYPRLPESAPDVGAAALVRDTSRDLFR